MKLKNISIIIPTYNRADFIGETINSFVKQKYPIDKYEIIVADNNSTDSTKDIVIELINKYPEHRISYLFESKQGVHYARNSASKAAKFEILYFTDDDMVATENLLYEIIVPFDFDPKVTIVTGRVLPNWLSPPPSWITKYCINPTLSLLDPPEQFCVSKSLPYVYSCHQAIKRDVFFNCEGFNPENTKGVWVGDGENGLNYKVYKQGLLFAFNGNSIIYHSIPQSRMTQTYLNKRIGNDAYVHTYSYYRINKPTRLNLLSNLFWTLFYYSIKYNLKYLVLMIRNNDIQALRFSIAYCFYVRNRIGYTFKLLFSQKWRKFVLKEDWLSNDLEFYNEI